MKDKQILYYRKKGDGPLWHFCTNCPDYPQESPIEATNIKPHAKDICDKCVKMDVEGKCEKK